ncbi:hypothetical protein MNV49_007033 [Pseudohyphozyma bogoriensis]|nr:hypothetical protein MNV49_007033 [Pseudohyphozyma bogoriensis]
MGLLHTSNHAALINSCYPKAVNAPVGELKPDGNALSKLAFYCAGRPKKLPKVMAVIYERAEKDARAASGGRARADLALTIDVVRGLVSDCRSELQCFAELALKVVELGLGRKEAGKRDVELEARAAGLFHAIAVYSSGTFMGMDEGLTRQYLRCLAMLSETAQLGSDHLESRWIALAALDGAASSELLYAATSDFGTQIRSIVPALLFSVSDAEAGTSSLGLPTSRKAATITPPEKTPTPSTLANRAVLTLRSIVRLSHAVQLSTKLTATSRWIDKYGGGKLWGEPQLIEWIGSSNVAASAVQYRATVVSWWADQVAGIKLESGAPSAKHNTLIDTLSAILRGPTSLVGLAIGSVLAQLTSLLVHRVPAGANDPLTPRLLSAIAALASKIYYFDQLNDIVSDLIEKIRMVKNGGGEAAAFDEEQRTRAMRSLIAALDAVLVEAKQGNTDVHAAVPVAKNGTSNGSSPRSDSPATNGGSEHRPPLPENDGTIRGNGVLLGNGQGLRSKKEADGEAQLDAMGRPIMRVTKAGRRNRVSSDVFRESLFLLLENDASLRAEYLKVLEHFVEEELDVGIGGEPDRPDDPWKDSTRFFSELHAAIYDLAASFTTSPSDSATNSPLNPATVILTRQDVRSRQSSLTSRRRSVAFDGPAPLATVDDYNGLNRIISAVQKRSSALAVTSGVPMLLTLDRDVAKWMQETSDVPKKESAAACHDLVATGLREVGEAWKVELPSPPTPPSPEWSSAVVEALASSQSLQAAVGFDRATLTAALSVTWSADAARSRGAPACMLIVCGWV